MPFRLKRSIWVSPLAKLVALALVAGIGVGATALIWEPRADQPENARPTTVDGTPGLFWPPQEQWRGRKCEPGAPSTFRPEQVSEGSIAVGDDLTTPVCSHYSG